FTIPVCPFVACMSVAIYRLPPPHVATLMRATMNSKLLVQKPQQARRQEAWVAARLIDRVAQPIVWRTMHDAGAHRKARLLEREQKFHRLSAMVDHVVLGTPTEVDGGLVVGD